MQYICIYIHFVVNQEVQVVTSRQVPCHVLLWVCLHQEFQSAPALHFPPLLLHLLCPLHLCHHGPADGKVPFLICHLLYNQWQWLVYYFNLKGTNCININPLHLRYFVLSILRSSISGIIHLTAIKKISENKLESDRYIILKFELIAF